MAPDDVRCDKLQSSSKNGSGRMTGFCPVRLESDPWIVQPTEHYEELTISEIIKRN